MTTSSMSIPSRLRGHRPLGARGLLTVAAVLAACGGLATLVDLPVARWMAARSMAAESMAARTPQAAAESQSPRGSRRLPGDLVRLLNLSEVFGYSPTAGIILLAALLLDPSLVRPRKTASPGAALTGLPGTTSAGGSWASAGGSWASAGGRWAGGRWKWRLPGSFRPRASLSPPFSLSADAMRMVAMTFSGGLTTDLIKVMVTRVRPYAASLDLHTSALDTFSNIEQVAGVAAQSFPSGHASVAAGLASALCWCYPRGARLFIPIAIAAAAQRLTSGSHYVSDVAAGAAIAVAWAAFWLGAAKRSDTA